MHPWCEDSDSAVTGDSAWISRLSPFVRATGAPPCAPAPSAVALRTALGRLGQRHLRLELDQRLARRPLLLRQHDLVRQAVLRVDDDRAQQVAGQPVADLVA